MILLLKLILAHLVGDFLLQPYAWVKEKESKKLASNKLYFHIGIHLLLNFLFLWNLKLWYIPLIIAVTHLAIDAWKLSFQNENNRRLLFFLDQLFHFLVIFGLYFLVERESIHFTISPVLLCYLTGAFFLTNPASIMIKTLISIYKYGWALVPLLILVTE